MTRKSTRDRMHRPPQARGAQAGDGASSHVSVPCKRNGPHPPHLWHRKRTANWCDGEPEPNPPLFVDEPDAGQAAMEDRYDR